MNCLSKLTFRVLPCQLQGAPLTEAEVDGAPWSFHHPSLANVRTPPNWRKDEDVPHHHQFGPKDLI